MRNPFRRHNGFIEHSVEGALTFFKESVLSEEYASRRGLLQYLDPRAKMVGFVFLLAGVMFMKDSRQVFAMYLACLALALCSRINAAFFLKRTWVFIPLFALFIAVPALFSSFTPGEPLWVFHVFGAQMTVTRQGFAGAELFVLRVLASVSLVVLLTITTRHTDLFAVMRGLGVPQVFVMTLSMCYRYIFLFAAIVQDMFLGIKSRTGGIIHHRKGQKIVAWNIASLWGRSMRMNEEVYNAMLSRGYTGEPRVMHHFRTRPADWIWLALSAAVLVVTVGGAR
jgi:cobalt/nickel transport system permease protein